MISSCNTIPEPYNEPVEDYLPDSRDRVLLNNMLEEQYAQELEVPLIIGGEKVYTGNVDKLVCPHDHQHVLATYHQAGPKEAAMAIEAAMESRQAWIDLEWSHRVSIFLKMADLISTKYRYILNSATMLGQSKSVHQAEIEATCEMADFLRFNVFYANEIYTKQPISTPTTFNRIVYRPLEGFVFAVTPFNFTAIAGNLASAPAIMGNTVVWKPATRAILSNYYLMQLYEEAGLPGGVINFIPGPGAHIADTVLRDSNLAGVHFTGSTSSFEKIWRQIAENISRYRNYPRLVGETGGKDYVFMHNSADIDATATAIVRAGYEYQGQKCSACSRVYAPRSQWSKLKEELAFMVKDIKVGDVKNFNNFMNAVIDREAYQKIMAYIDTAKQSTEADIIIGGHGDDTKGYFIEPTIIQTSNPNFVTMQEEIFGPVVTVFVYDDDQYQATLELCDRTSPYGLTGAIFAKDRRAISSAQRILYHSAGNFYINDKPSGSIVGQQPFGGSRASGTNDKAGSFLNLTRWITAQAVKENFAPPKDFRYPHMQVA